MATRRAGLISSPAKAAKLRASTRMDSTREAVPDTSRARGAGGHAEGLLGEVKLVGEGGVLVDQVLVLGVVECLLTLELVDLVPHGLVVAVIFGGMDGLRRELEVVRAGGVVLGVAS